MKKNRRFRKRTYIQDYYVKKRKAEQIDCLCPLCKHFDEKCSVCTKGREKTERDGVWT